MVRFLSDTPMPGLTPPSQGPAHRGDNSSSSSSNSPRRQSFDVEEPGASSSNKASSISRIFPFIATTAKPTVLIVEDDVINLRMLQLYCKSRGLSSLCTRNGQDGIEIFKRRQSAFAAGVGKSTPIQLILMDLQMPLCDGIEATRQIRALEAENDWGCSVLFMVSTEDDPAVMQASEEAGADDYYIKPLPISCLDAAVKRFFPLFEHPSADGTRPRSSLEEHTPWFFTRRAHRGQRHF